MRQRLRIFVSSPGDVMAAREVAAQVIEKVAQDYQRFFTIEPYLWEYEPMLASGHFQDSIDPPSRFDAVILILESRLGTPLPERTAVREYRGIDGRTPVTGTEWEFEDALAAARDRGVPDLLVYRSQKNVEISTLDSRSRQATLAQIEALESFWSRHFADRQTFIGGYSQFRSLEEFSAKFEQDLRRCVQRRIEQLGSSEQSAAVQLWPKAPFRGLEAYEFEHAPIFFGRDEAIGVALLRLLTNAQAHRAFLLVLGASGSGKSSLVKAGVVPRLLVPQRVSGTAFLARVLFRPSDARGDEDLFDALARCLAHGTGVNSDLSELLGASMPLAEFAKHLREAAGHPGLPFAMMLDRLAEAARTRGRMLNFEQAKLILIVDQLEELFTAERVQPEQRTRFVQLLAGLARSGRVWVIATMRADFWHRAGEMPELIQLADGLGRLDLLPPTPAELSQMIRRPADAAAISFETDVSTGIPLNDLIAEEAAREPGTLPLLSYLLDQLYQSDVHEAGGGVLTYASYKALGGLKGAIATRADAVVAAQPREVRAALRQVLFALVQMSATDGSVERAVARRAALSDFPPGTPKRRLIDALLDPAARLLVADAVGGHTATVRLAHEALINEWQMARDFVSGNAEALKTRRMLEERYRRWSALAGSGKAAVGPASALSSLLTALRRPFEDEHGLLTDVDLSDAGRLLQHYREELAPDLVAFVERSILRNRRRRQRTVRAVAAVAAVMTVLAIGAGYEAKVASAQRDTALQAQQRSLTQTAAARLNEGDVAGSSSIILEVLRPRSARRPYLPDALSVFQEARAADVESIAMTGHSGRVRSAAFSPDGAQVVTASNDKTARIWDAATGRQLLLLSGHTDGVIRAAFSPDGKHIVTASFDKTARIWDAATGRQMLLLSGHTDRLFSAMFSPDGQQIITASADKTARIWDAATGRQVWLLSGHTEGVISASFSPDGKHIVTGSIDKTARIWEAGTGRQLLILSGHTQAVVSVAFSPDGRQIITGALDKTARIWDAATGRPVSLLSGHTEGVISASFSPDATQVITAAQDWTARVWDTATGSQVLLLRGHTDGTVYSALFSPDGKQIVTASADKTARIWDTAGRQVLLFSGNTDWVNHVAYSPDGKQIVTASADKTARIWDAATARQLLLLSGHTGAVNSAVYSPDGKQVVSASSDKTVRIWDAATGRQLLQLSGHDSTVYSAMFSPDGKQIVTASYDKTARIWDAATGRQAQLLSGHTDGVLGATFSPDGKHIVTASFDKTARFWDAATGRQVSVLSGHSDIVASAAFSPDGKQIITGSSDKTARIWDAATARQVLLLSGPTDRVASAAFSPDGKQIATASADKTVRIWDAATGWQMLLLSGHTDGVNFAAFSPDGRQLVTSSNDRTARIWDARVDGLETQIEWAEAAQFDPPSATERFRLGLPRSSDVRAWPADASPCDRAAAAPYDPDRRASGMMRGQMVPDIGLAACAPAGGNRDKDMRMVYQHGRALMAHGDSADASRDFELAIGGRYRAAQIDLAMLLSTPAALAADPRKAIELYEHAWKDGVKIAAFQLGNLYEHGVSEPGTSERYALAPDTARAWIWYQQAADAGEPNALARFAERQDASALAEDNLAKRHDSLLDAFKYYAAASDRARTEDWPDDAWRNWRYRRASLARILAREGMMQQVADVYEDVRKQSAQPAPMGERIAELLGMNRAD